MSNPMQAAEQEMPDRSMPPVNLMRRDASDAALQRDVDYGMQVMSGFSVWTAGQGYSLSGKRAMEIGPGINLVGCIGLRALGAAKVYVADRWIAPWQDDYNPVFCRMMAERIRAEGRPWDASVFDHVATNGYQGTLELVPSAAEDLAKNMPEQVDAIYSNAVLEHMADHRATVHALARITAPGGINFHQVDFRYHENFDRPLDYLLMTRAEFERESIAKHYELGCQLRPHELRSMFEDAGFQLAWYPNAVVTEPYLAEFLPQLRSSQSVYRDTPKELLREIGGLYVLRR